MAREFDSDEEIVLWADSLDERWPERLDVRQHIIALIRDLGMSQPRIVELCSGDGRFAKEILKTTPDARYVGVDASESLLAYFEKTLAQSNVAGVLADLREPNALAESGPADVVVTLQSMHDVGGPVEISNLYAKCFGLLEPDGQLIVSDFVVPDGEVDPKQPGRLPIAWHIEALSEAGFEVAECSIEVGKLGCLVGRKGTS